MQTFEALLPASHTAPARHAETNLSSKKPDQAGEKFGDVMERALTHHSHEPNNDDSETPGGDLSSTKDAPAAIGTDDAAKSKKSHHQNRAKVDLTAAQPAAVDVVPVHISHPLHINQLVPKDEGTSDDDSKTGTDKGKQTATAGNTDDASQLAAPHFLALTGMPLVASLPTTLQPQVIPQPQATNGTRATKEAKGSSNPVTTISGKTTASNTSPALAKILDPDADSEESADSVDPNTNPKNAVTKDTADHADQPVSKGIDAPKPDLTLLTSEPHSDQSDLTAALKAIAPEAQPTQTAQTKVTGENSNIAFDLNGTSAAKQDMTMKKADKMTKVAEPAEQDLPGSTATGSEELPAGQKLSVKDLSHVSNKLESPAVVESPAAAKISTSVEPAAPAITAAAVTPTASIDTRVMERTHDIVALHAMRLAQTGSDSLHVVVKPGAGIQLSLELRQSQAGIEVRASLHKGDFEHLSQYWPELQQRLETRGVRVGTLTTSDNFSNSSQQQFQQSKQQSSNQDPLYAGAFAEFALAGTMSEAPAVRAARATAYRGWETWA